jgi:hypothetical protein
MTVGELLWELKKFNPSDEFFIDILNKDETDSRTYKTSAPTQSEVGSVVMFLDGKSQEL